MEIAKSLEYLRRDLQERIAWQTKRLRWERFKALVLKTLAVVLAGGITVLLGLEGDFVNQEATKNIALVFGAVIVVLNAWEAFFDHRGLWIMHTTNRARMDALATDIEFYLAAREPGEVTAADAERFAQRYRQLGEAGLARWLQLHDETVGDKPPAQAEDEAEAAAE